MHLDQIVPWGRSFEEYRAMFALGSAELAGRILGCADGPASFNCRASANGGRVVSVDPLYAFSAEQIRGRIEQCRPIVLEQTRLNRHQYVWTTIPSIEALDALRTAAMEDFLADFEPGRLEGRYLPAELPALPFEAGAFDLALCSHFLFLYSEQLSGDFHVRAALELARVAAEVRIFPLVDLEARPSPHVDAVRQAAQQAGLLAEICPVPYEFQRGGNRMLRIRRTGAS